MDLGVEQNVDGAGEKYVVSRQAASTASRSGLSPFRNASRVCSWRQKAQPLICEVLTLSSSTSNGSRPAAAAWSTT